jgi:hypothetical protein
MERNFLKQTSKFCWYFLSYPTRELCLCFWCCCFALAYHYHWTPYPFEKQLRLFYISDSSMIVVFLYPCIITYLFWQPEAVYRRSISRRLFDCTICGVFTVVLIVQFFCVFLFFFFFFFFLAFSLLRPPDYDPNFYIYIFSLFFFIPIYPPSFSLVLWLFSITLRLGADYSICDSKWHLLFPSLFIYFFLTFDLFDTQ